MTGANCQARRNASGEVECLYCKRKWDHPSEVECPEGDDAKPASRQPREERRTEIDRARERLRHTRL